jgi:CheY-like chemotaxis protein
VQSRPGEGSCFSFDVWLKTGKSLADETPKVLAAQPGKLKVLIAEDNAINILVTRKFLQKWDMEVDVAYNGKEAIEKIQASQYDLVLMDVQMPVMDGITTIKKLRGEKLFTGPVILLTADAFINSNNQVSSWGFDDYLLKPFGAEELYKKISQLILQETE